MAFDASGGWLVTAGADGSMFVFGMPSVAAVDCLAPLAPLSSRPGSAAQGPPADLDAYDEPCELTAAEQHSKSCAEAALLATAGGHTCGGLGGGAAPAAGTGMTDGTVSMQQALVVLKRRLQDAMARNAAADELERVERKDLIVDTALMQELQDGAEARVQVLVLVLRGDTPPYVLLVMTAALMQELLRTAWMPLCKFVFMQM